MKWNHLIKLIIIFIVGTLFSCYNVNIKFDSNQWKKNGGEAIVLDTRYKMVNDLIESKLLINKNEMEVADLIGNPEKLNTYNNGDSKYYPVKEEYGLDIDPEKMIFLRIHYNKNNLSDSVELIGND